MFVVLQKRIPPKSLMIDRSLTYNAKIFFLSSQRFSRPSWKKSLQGKEHLIKLNVLCMNNSLKLSHILKQLWPPNNRKKNKCQEKNERSLIYFTDPHACVR